MEGQRLCCPNGDKNTIRQSGILENLLIKDIKTNSQLAKVLLSSHLTPTDSGVAVKRHSTESAMLRSTSDQYTPGQYNEQDQYATNKPLTTNSPRAEDGCRQINITKVADKFLLGTMEVLFSKGGIHNLNALNTLQGLFPTK